MTTRKRSTLRPSDFLEVAAWQGVGDYLEDADPEYQPVRFDAAGRVPASAGYVHCRCVATFSDGTKHEAVGICGSHSEEGPELVSVLRGEQYHRVMVPPAPPFVLEAEGPAPFAKAFDRSVADVFPLSVEVVAKFEIPPHIRHVVLDTGGMIPSRSEDSWRLVCSVVQRINCPVRARVVFDGESVLGDWSLSGVWIPTDGYLELGGEIGPVPLRDVRWVELNPDRPTGGLGGIPASTRSVRHAILEGLRDSGVEWSLVDGNYRISNYLSANAVRPGTLAL